MCLQIIHCQFEQVFPPKLMFLRIFLENILLVAPGTIPKTTSGKIKRFDIKNKIKEIKEVNSSENSWKILVFLTWIYSVLLSLIKKPENVVNNNNSGDLAAKERENKFVEIQNFLIATIAKQLAIEASSIDTESPLIQYGLKSIDAVAICAGN